MARSIRIEYAGAFYHVMARGNRREPIFADESDRGFFLQTLGEACGMTGWRIHAWVVMVNHYHLCLETPEPNLVEGMKWLQNTYTRRFNVRHRLWGRLFGDRYVKLGEGASVLDYAWSSVAGGYALPPRRRPPWLAGSAALEAGGCQD
jgi:REP element-mobilizing transposase RayT